MIRPCYEEEGGGKGVTYQLAINLQIPKAQKGLNVRILKRNEPKPFTPPRLTVQHNRRINHFPELGKKLAHTLGSDAARQTTDEELRGALVFLSRDGSFRVDLRIKWQVGLSFFVRVRKGERNDSRFSHPKNALAP